jgi:hypothetical protein
MEAPARRRPVAPSLVAFAVFTLLAIGHTWPLASNPAHLSRNDNGDTLLNTWVIAWVAHQLPRHPLHVFDAPIFHPQRLTLGYTEAMIVQGVMAMPILAAGGSPVLAYNVVLIAGMALTGWAFCLLVRRWTGSWAAGYLAGSLAAFNSFVLMRLPHLQTQHVEFIALVLFALDRLVVSATPARRGLARRGLCAAGPDLGVPARLHDLDADLRGAGQGGRVAAARAGPDDRLAHRGRGGRHAADGPYLWAYYSLHRLTGVERTMEEARAFAGSWVSYLISGSRVHFGLWSRRFFGQSESPGFPGVTALVLVALALAGPKRGVTRAFECAWPPRPDARSCRCCRRRRSTRCCTGRFCSSARCACPHASSRSSC